MQEFRDKKQDLKDWLYGTVHKRYDREEEAEIVQQDVENFFTDEWFENVIQSTLQKQIEMIEGEIESRRRTITLTQILDILGQYR